MAIGRHDYTGLGASLKDQFSANAGMGWGSFSSKPSLNTPRNTSPEKTPTVVDFTKNKNFHLPDIKPANKTSSAKVNAQETNTAETRQEVSTVKQDYMKTNDLIASTMVEGMKHVAGADTAHKIGAQLIFSGGSTKTQAAITIADPSGTAGSIYTILSTLRDENKNVPPAEISRILDETATVLREASEAVAKGEKPAIPIPEGLDFADVTGAEMRAFLERDPMKDPIMQDAQKIEIALDDIDENNSRIKGHEHRDGDQVEKAITALETNNNGAIAELKIEAIPFKHNAFGALTAASSSRESAAFLNSQKGLEWHHTDAAETRYIQTSQNQTPQSDLLAPEPTKHILQTGMMS